MMKKRKRNERKEREYRIFSLEQEPPRKHVVWSDVKGSAARQHEEAMN